MTEKSPVSSLLFTRRQSPVDLPDAIIGAPLAAASSLPDHAGAKAGDLRPAAEVAKLLITPDLLARVQRLVGDGELIYVPVLAEEATGRNKLPLAAAEALAAALGGSVWLEVTQNNRALRTGLDGLQRLFAPALFGGAVQYGGRHVLVDDTLTQGGTFAGMAAHIRARGGHVVGAVALTGKQYSAKLSLSPEILQHVRARFADVEDDFRAAAGHGFDCLTESEGRYLATAKPIDAIRDRIVAAGDAARPSDPEGVAQYGRAQEPKP